MGIQRFSVPAAVLVVLAAAPGAGVAGLVLSPVAETDREVVALWTWTAVVEEDTAIVEHNGLWRVAAQVDWQDFGGDHLGWQVSVSAQHLTKGDVLDLEDKGEIFFTQFFVAVNDGSPQLFNPPATNVAHAPHLDRYTARLLYFGVGAESFIILDGIHVPEPASWMLCGIGSTVLIGLARTRRRRAPRRTCSTAA